MKLFKKKNEEDKLGYKIGHNIFGDVWEDKKDRSIVLLIVWFFFIIFVVLFINSSPKQENNKPKYQDPKELLSNLSNYEYDLTVTNKNDNTITYYNGNITDGIDTGTKKINEEEINYKIIDGITYDLEGNQIDYPYYDISLNIFNYFEDYYYRYLDNKIMTYIYDINYENDTIKVYLKTTYDKISLVNYDYLDNSYTINISY